MTRTVDIGEYRVEIDVLASIAHHCDPVLCRRTGSCCAEYDIWVGDAEVDRMVGMMPEAARFARHLRDADGRLVNAFQDLGPDAYAIEEGPDGTCIFAYCGARGQHLCSLHSAALEAGLPPQSVKPDCCFTWPLSIATSIPPVVSIQEDALDFPCNSPREPDGGLDEGIAAIVEVVFGTEFLAELLEAL